MGEHDDLLIRWELGLTDAGDEAALAAALRDPEVRRIFVRNARVAAALGTPATLSAQPASERVFTSGTTRQRKAFRVRTARAPRWSRVVIAASVALVSGVFALFLVLQRPASTATAPVVKPTTPATIPQPVFARLIHGTGTRIVPASGVRRDARNGEVLAPGDTIESSGGAATVMLGQAVARLELEPNSSMLLPSGITNTAASPVRLGLTSGRLTAEVAPRQPGSPFVVTSTAAEVAVIGTRFTFGLSSDQREADLTVTHGSVRLSTPTDAGVVVPTGRSALVSEGLVSMRPPAPAPDPALPSGSRILWRAPATDAEGWRGVIDSSLAGGAAWRSVAPSAGDVWSLGELRTPVKREGWTVAQSTWLRFRYHVERFSPGLALEVHFKPSDETNYAFRMATDTTDGWHEALLRVDGEFRHLGPQQQPLAVGEVIHGAVWCVLRDGKEDAKPARFWIRDVVVFANP